MTFRKRSWSLSHEYVTEEVGKFAVPELKLVEVGVGKKIEG